MSSLTSAQGSSETSQPKAPFRARWSGIAEKRLATLVVVVAAALYLLPINQFTDNYDEGVYWQSLRAMSQGHPLYTSVFSSQPPYFLTSLYPFYAAFGQSLAAARVGVAVFGLVGVIAMFWLGSELGGYWTGLLASTLLVFEPIYLAQARTVESDGPAVAISILAIALAVAASNRAGATRRWLAFISGAVVVYGILIKLFAVVALVPMVLYLCMPILSAFKTDQGRLRRPDMAELRAAVRSAAPDLVVCAAGAAAATILLLAPFLGSFTALWNQVITFHVAPEKVPLTALSSGDGSPNLSYALVGLLLVAVVGLVIWGRARSLAIPLLWLAASIMTLARLNVYFGHYAVLVTPIVVLLIALAAGLIAPALTHPVARWPALVAGALLIGVLAQNVVNDITTTATIVTRGIPARAQSQLAAINAFTTPGELVVTDDQYMAAQTDHSVPPELVDTSYVRITTGYLTAPQIERIIERDHIRVVILSTNRLRNLPEFMPWLLSHYTLVAHAGSGFDIYVRVAQPNIA